MVEKYDYLIIGCGFSGAVLAERLAKDGKKILIIDKRSHIGGNAYDFYNDQGILIHKYGPHIFHTNSKKIFDYLSNFTDWNLYQHKVLAYIDGQKVPIPININTINSLFGYNFNEVEIQKYYDSLSENLNEIKNSEDVIVNKVGKVLFEKFYKNYTKKQWDLYPNELDKQVTSRVPIRINKDNRYFTDKYQGLPLNGYTKLFENMLNNKNIHIMLNVDFKDIINIIKFEKMIYTGPIDYYFNYKFNKLSYRSLEFKFKTIDKNFYQEVGTVNYPNDYNFTRITEFKHLTNQIHNKTCIVKEFPKSEGDPYYPIPKKENQDLFKKYASLIKGEKNVYFLGRLALYKYYNMDQCVGAALELYEKIKNE